MCAHGYTDAHRGQKGVLDPVGLELQVFVSYLNHVLGSELHTTERAKGP